MDDLDILNTGELVGTYRIIARTWSDTTYEFELHTDRSLDRVTRTAGEATTEDGVVVLRRDTTAVPLLERPVLRLFEPMTLVLKVADTAPFTIRSTTALTHVSVEKDGDA